VSDEEFIGSGSFRIDRSRAVRKMARWRFSDDVRFYDLFIRAANAAKATHVRIRQQGGWCEIRHDGAPLHHSSLEDPYASLLGEGEAAKTPAERQTALGLLRLFQGSPSSVTLRTGEPGRRMILRLLPEEGGAVKEELELDEGNEETETAVQIEWSRWDTYASKRFRIDPVDLATRCQMSRASIAVGESLIHAPEEDLPGEHQVEAGPTLVRLAADDATDPSRLRLFHYGVFVEELEFHDTARPFRAWADSTDFILNASLAAVRQDTALREVLDAIARAQKGLDISTDR